MNWEYGLVVDNWYFDTTASRSDLLLLPKYNFRWGGGRMVGDDDLLVLLDQLGSQAWEVIAMTDHPNRIVLLKRAILT